jgi:uncharacterized membrane protein YdjX (TVP38/TMEM64 family)
MTHSNGSSRPAAARHLPLVLILVVALVGALTLKDYVTFDTLRDNRQWLLSMRDQHYWQLVVGFVGTYVLIVAFSLPGAAVASVAGGFLFGLVAGTGFNVLSATLGATAIFLAARMGLGAMLSERLDASHGTIQKLRAGLRTHEVSVLLLLRLVPVVPFFVANLVPALVGVRFWNYLWTTAVGIIPGGIVFTWIGVGLGEVFDRGENPDLSLLWEPFVIGPILGLCALAALPIVINALRNRKDG